MNLQFEHSGRLGLASGTEASIKDNIRVTVDQEFILYAGSIGIGATLVMDLYAIFLKRTFGVSSLKYAMVGRWMGHIIKGRFRHDAIARASPVTGETAIGWCAHYAIGVIFAGVLLAIWGIEWAHQPTLFPALIIGIVSVAAPFFILQPGMGAGIAASKTPEPDIARRRSVVAHLSFGMGLYLSALVLSILIQS